MDAAGVERDAVGERVREMETDLARSKSELRNAVEILDEHAGKLLDVRKKVLADETIDRCVHPHTDPDLGSETQARAAVSRTDRLLAVRRPASTRTFLPAVGTS